MVLLRNQQLLNNCLNLFFNYFLAMVMVVMAVDEDINIMEVDMVVLLVDIQDLAVVVTIGEGIVENLAFSNSMSCTFNNTLHIKAVCCVCY